jgi:hypothetical protein
LELTIRHLDVGDNAIARRLVGIAFAGEPFAVGMGSEPLSSSRILAVQTCTAF